MTAYAHRNWLALLLLVLGTACGNERAQVTVAGRGFVPFQNNAYPVLLRDCAFPACHGAPERFFRVYGPGRTRMIRKATGLPYAALDLPSGEEIALSMQLALSMIDERDLGRSLLLRKPLAIEAGGSGHMGIDNYGRDVYRTAQDEGFKVLAAWVYGPRTAPPMSVQGPMTPPTMMTTPMPAMP